jgi:hypothetical protein
MNELETAEKILGELMAKRDAHAKRGAGLIEARGEISYAANTGDQVARKKLDALNHEFALHQSELENFAAAIAEATKRVDAARRDEAEATTRTNAREAREIWAEVVEDLYAADNAMVEANARINAAYSKLRTMHSLGAKFPSAQQFIVNGAMVASTSLMPTPWHREFRHLSPHEKRTWKGLLEGLPDVPNSAKRIGWKVIVDNQLREILGEPADTSKDAAA